MKTTMAIKNMNIEKIYNSGQCFTIFKNEDEYWCVGTNKYCRVTQLDESSCGVTCNLEDKDYWLNFFDAFTDYDIIREGYLREFPDTVTSEVVENSKGLRLLNQEFLSCLISFITSQRKTVSAIRKVMQRFIHTYGSKYKINKVDFPGTNVEYIYTFPTLADLVEQISKDELDAMGLGYRSGYIYDMVKYSPVTTSDFSNLSYSQAVSSLKSIRGVGDKIANCVALYSLGYRNAYPRDVWILNFESVYYNGHFEDERCGDYAGVIQLWQYYAVRTF